MSLFRTNLYIKGERRWTNLAEINVYDTKLRLSFETGMNHKGEPVFKTKTYANVKKASTADELFRFAQAIALLSTDPLAAIVRNDSSDIVG